MHKTVALIDVGNSRAKLLLMRSPRVEEGELIQIDYRADPCALVETLSAEPSLAAIVVASVGSEAVLTNLSQWASDQSVYWQVMESEPERDGLVNGYREPSSLGVDRWLAMVGARMEEDGALCVVDIGTATTLESITADGRHLGGIIIPGPRLMEQALMNNTARIDEHASGEFIRLPADNTADALRRGGIWAIASLIDNYFGKTCELTDKSAKLLVTGGAAPAIMPLLTAKCRWIERLVFQGMWKIFNDNNN